MSDALFRSVDSVQIPVPDLDDALTFYRDQLGHELLWRTETQAGLEMGDSDTELVVQTEREESEIDLLVESVDSAVEVFDEKGGKILVEPFDIPRWSSRGRRRSIR